MKPKAVNRHYAKLAGGKIRHPNRPDRQKFPIPAWRFREARLQCGLGVGACADLLRVSERTIRGWESGTTRIPYAAYKLMRLLKGGKVLGPEWRDFFVYRNVLITPEGHRFEAGEMAWWSLLVRRAKAFGDLLRAGTGKAESGTDRPADLCGVSNTAHLSQTGTPETSALGLVSSSTSDTLDRGRARKRAPDPLTGLSPARGPAGGSGRLARALRAAGGGR